MHLSAHRADVAAGTADGGGVDVGGVQFDAAHSCRQGSAHSTRTAAQIDDDGARPGAAGRLLDEVLRAVTRDENAGVHGNVPAGELSPAKEMFKG
ncbi:hypothetical protein GCM10023063_42250 [Arthrobacter methylotrophus]